MKSKAKVKDWRQGRVLFTVSAFAHREGGVATVYEIFPARRPKVSAYMDSLFGAYMDSVTSKASLVYGLQCQSLSDKGIIPNDYNFHKTFTKRKAAERYAAYIRSGKLSALDATKCAEFARRELDYPFEDLDYTEEEDYCGSVY